MGGGEGGNSNLLGEQSVGVEEGWKIKLERREAASLGRALPAGWAETSGCRPRD